MPPVALRGRTACLGQRLSTRVDFVPLGTFWPCPETLLIVMSGTTSSPEKIRVHVHTDTLIYVYCKFY